MSLFLQCIHIALTGDCAPGPPLSRSGDLDVDTNVRPLPCSIFVSLLSFIMSLFLFSHNNCFISKCVHVCVCVMLDSFSAPSSSCIPLGRSLHTLCPASDHTLFLYGGLGITGEPMSKSKCTLQVWLLNKLHDLLSFTGPSKVGLLW